MTAEQLGTLIVFCHFGAPIVLAILMPLLREQPRGRRRR